MLLAESLLGSSSAETVYIEDVFSTWLHTTNGGAQTINNGIDLAGKGGLVWLKARNQAFGHALVDTVTGASKYLSSNTSSAQLSGNFVTAFNANGFTEASGYSAGTTLASWTFRKQPKFFDVVTYTGNGGTLSVNHALASKPGCIIIKRTSGSSDWLVCTRKSDGNIFAMYLNQTAGQFYDGTEGSLWTPTTVSINWINSNVASGYNDSGAQYVMYLFAHNAGGFGATGADNVISCGSVTTDGSGQIPNVNLGWEPQWVMLKPASGIGGWEIYDILRGWISQNTNQFNRLRASDSTAEVENINGPAVITATGFRSNTLDFGANVTYIYIAIRRGPMRTPTSGTSVFDIDISGNASAPAFTAAFPVDFNFIKTRNNVDPWYVSSRLTGSNWLEFQSTVEGRNDPNIKYDYQNGTWSSTSLSLYTGWNFRRAPGFFDVVCYTGNGTPGRTLNHNLGVVPELMIVKRRDAAAQWPAYAAPLGATNFVSLNLTNASAANSQIWNDTAPTASVFTVGSNMVVNSGAPGTYVAYLFASCPGVSKVGSYTGTGSTQTINCGFAAGARFVLIKRTDSTGDWYVWDSARGIVAGNDPYLLLNSTAAEVTNTDWVDTAASGFELSNSGGNLVNINGASYIFLAIA